MDDTGLTPKDRGPRPPAEPEIKRVVFCSGKVFYDLHDAREKQGKVGEVAIVRVEQLAPFPFDLVCREIRRYPNAQLLWCQEEPMNMGAYMHVQPRFDTCLREEGKPMMGRMPYAGRPPMAATATGFGEVHGKEQARLIANALDVNYSGAI